MSTSTFGYGSVVLQVKKGQGSLDDKNTFTRAIRILGPIHTILGNCLTTKINNSYNPYYPIKRFSTTYLNKPIIGAFIGEGCFEYCIIAVGLTQKELDNAIILNGSNREFRFDFIKSENDYSLIVRNSKDCIFDVAGSVKNAIGEEEKYPYSDGEHLYYLLRETYGEKVFYSKYPNDSILY